MSRRAAAFKPGGPLPERYLNTDWNPPNRSEEREALSIATPAEVVKALGETLSDTRRQRLDDIAASRLFGVVVVLEDLRDPHNGGAALRSCEAMGLSEVHVVESKERFRVSSKITQGCDKWLEVISHKSAGSCLSDLKRRGYRLCAAVPGAALSLEELDPLQPTAFLLGNEHAGLSPDARALCDTEFAIPLHGFSESLNLSVATALIVYTHTSRRRRALSRSGDLDAEALVELMARYYARDVRGAAALVRRYKAALTNRTP